MPTQKWYAIPPNLPTDESYHWTRRPFWSAAPLYLQFRDDPPRWVETFSSAEIPLQDITRFRADVPATLPYSLTVSGALTPDFTGIFSHIGHMNGAWYYQRGTDPCYIFYVPTFSAWAMASLALPYPADFWTSFGQPDPTNVENTYTPQGTYLGDATVVET
jgi:hypothetical protein